MHWEEKHQINIPKKHHIASLLVRHYHEQVAVPIIPGRNVNSMVQMCVSRKTNILPAQKDGPCSPDGTGHLTVYCLSPSTHSSRWSDICPNEDEDVPSNGRLMAVDRWKTSPFSLHPETPAVGLSNEHWEGGWIKTLQEKVCSKEKERKGGGGRVTSAQLSHPSEGMFISQSVNGALINKADGSRPPQAGPVLPELSPGHGDAQKISGAGWDGWVGGAELEAVWVLGSPLSRTGTERCFIGSRGSEIRSPYPTQLGFVIGSPPPQSVDTPHHLTHLNECKMSNQQHVRPSQTAVAVVPRRPHP
ncbi:unnamed protein product [Menidia menidia]|uniref:(Atlantic silverside) hypothetical protein n=1 Tax=Menidia menidia TaxID=238744 RepID=A0A8S4BEE3_9TELE|nr:unnamed protein product [Menidia menidia]